MRIIATCDLHYNIARSKAPTEAIAREICKLGGDVLLLLGDLCGIDLNVLGRVFELFEPFTGVKLYVPGNHEMWTPPGSDTMDRYRREIPALCREHGVRPLEEQPFIEGDTAIVGSMGWYDYSFRTQALEIPLRFYENKVAPGTASYREEFAHLLTEREDVSDDAMRIICRWMDGAHVRLPCTDLELTNDLVARLRTQLEAVSTVKQVVVGMHQLPFADLVPPGRTTALSFATAFLGSERFGALLTEFPNVTRALCGHSHHWAECRRNALHATAIGSTYTAKRYEVLDV